MAVIKKQENWLLFTYTAAACIKAFPSRVHNARAARAYARKTHWARTRGKIIAAHGHDERFAGRGHAASHTAKVIEGRAATRHRVELEAARHAQHPFLQASKPFPERKPFGGVVLDQIERRVAKQEHVRGRGAARAVPADEGARAAARRAHARDLLATMMLT